MCPLLTPPAYGRGVATVPGWVGPPPRGVGVWARRVANLGPTSAVPFLRAVPPAFQLILLNSLGWHRTIWAWVARVDSPLPSRALQAWG